MPLNARPWSVGDEKMHTLIYDSNENPVAVARTHRLAEIIVDAVNAPPREDRSDD